MSEVVSLHIDRLKREAQATRPKRRCPYCGARYHSDGNYECGTFVHGFGVDRSVECERRQLMKVRARTNEPA